MVSWEHVERSAPELAASIRRAFDAHKHKSMATLRRDGSPRLSGVEAHFVDGDLWLGMMRDSRKALDLRRDPRVALHSATADPDLAGGDAKVSGRAAEVEDPDVVTAVLAAMGGEGSPDGAHLFRVDLDSAVLTSLGGDPPDHLVIDRWTTADGLRRTERR